MKIVIGRCLLQDLLDARGLSHVQLSDKTKIAASQISEYAKNKRGMSLINAKKIAIALKCCIDDLYEFIIEKE